MHPTDLPRQEIVEKQSDAKNESEDGNENVLSYRNPRDLAEATHSPLLVNTGDASDVGSSESPPAGALQPQPMHLGEDEHAGKAKQKKSH